MRHTLLPSFVALVALFVACDDDPSGPGPTSGVDAGISLDAPASAEGSTDAPPGNGTCSIDGNNYRIYGAQIFKVSENLRMSYVAGKVANQNGLPFGNATIGVQIGSTLVVSDPNCPFCGITLPPVFVNGTVQAEPLTSGISGVKYLFDPGIPNNVVVWLGGKFFLYDLATKKEVANAGIAFNGSGLFCNKLYAMNGSIMTGSYSVRMLAECGDGSGPTWATLIDAGGVETTPNNWTQQLFQSVASTKGSPSKYQITKADLSRGIFVDTKNVYKVDAGAFVPDPTVYEQCNPANGIINPGIPVLNVPLL